MAVRHLKGHVSWVQTVVPEQVLAALSSNCQMHKLTHIGGVRWQLNLLLAR